MGYFEDKASHPPVESRADSFPKTGKITSVEGRKVWVLI
jgi:hypothetical protein